MILDCHVHLPSAGLDRAWEWAPCTPDLAAAVRYLRKCGVERAIANSMRGELAKTPEEMRAGNDEAVQAAREHAGFLLPACLVNADLAEEALAEIRRCHDELGMVWIGELCGYASGYRYDTDAFARAMALASDLNMVVQIHSEGWEEMDRLCGEFPRLTWVLAHIGDSPEECKRRCQLAAKHRHLHLDICGHGYQRMGILEYAVKCATADRVLFGSDFTINDPAGVIARVQKADFDDETKAKILGGNAERLLAERGVR
jgi:predicted TIM-barrel fold metal-dependent hydrolase